VAAGREYTRNTLDVNVIPAVHERTFLPVLVDPSHATGRADLVPMASLAGLDFGANGLIIEVIGRRTERSSIECDASQGIRPDVLKRLIAECHQRFDAPEPWPSMD
jgi:3-deoxy-7-phosphoheptulonate synthase